MRGRPNGIRRTDLGEASLDVLDSLATVGPMTIAELAADTGRDPDALRKTCSNLRMSWLIESHKKPGRTTVEKTYAITRDGELRLKAGR